MAENKSAKYLKYAVGEIVLVMIGILLALQVSNWNQERIAKNKEQLLIQELHDEFVQNKKQLEDVNLHHRRAMESVESVIALFPIDPENINLDTLRKLSVNMGWQNTFNPSQGIIKSLVNSSSFELISDPDLRRLLVSWEDILADYQEEENKAVYNMQSRYLPAFGENIPGWFEFKDKRIDLNYLSSFQFENIFLSRGADLRDILGNSADELGTVQETIEKIIELSTPKGG